MKRTAAFPVLVLALVMLVSSAFAQRAACPAGGFSLSLPDSFSEQPFSPSEDPDLCFFWHGEGITVQAYASYLGEVAPSSLFQVLTGNETDSGMVSVNGMQMVYGAGSDASGSYLLYSWMDRGNNVTLYFYYPSGDASSLSQVDRIIHSISFDAGH